MDDLIPVSIDGEYLPETEFVNRINMAYQNVSDFRHGKPCYLGWTRRSKASAFIRWLFRDIYLNEPFKHFNGLAEWQKRFERFLEEDGDKYSKCYLQEVLVAELHRSLDPKKGQKLPKIHSYRDYVIAAIKDQYVPPVDLRWSEDKGWGLFATDNIPPFNLIGLYTGDLRFTFLLRLIEKLRGYHNKYKWSLYGAEWLSVDGEKNGQHTRFINHDIEKTERVATLTLEPHEVVPTFKFLQKGLIAYKPKVAQGDELFPFVKDEEIVWDYGEDYRLPDDLKVN